MASHHILAPLCHHVHQFQFVSWILVELDVDDAPLGQDILNCRTGHSQTAEEFGAGHVTMDQLATLVDEETRAVVVVEVLDTLRCHCFDELHVNVPTGQIIHDFQHQIAYRQAKH